MLLCRFMYSPAMKARLMRFENKVEQMREFRSALMNSLMAGSGVLPFLYLKVSCLTLVYLSKLCVCARMLCANATDSMTLCCQHLALSGLLSQQPTLRTQ